ncbi:succinate dehydrogenase, hydrophobic membrane anchor protein [Rubellimicrobium aerolatum]|uniref:Succinate dehydrogenase hydrophobic membrane anchor subunit n=1 Tax=Rubellimicrobium aerolatum TaxID=490979 RepID=A0ABW0S9J2_9RHOB|nr:succinate dehydrogenase, hydrophobic membrane anchor protein [Rubellimicrobium aerolatum]MBP1804973.1 succinate dehydrogenase / fumarate reductase membrane anchor subunit [Rubellimicrobium aerolatum]
MSRSTSYITARKRAENLGASGGGTDHFWLMEVTSIALVILVPLFVFTFGSILGLPHEEAVAALSRPFPALVIGLTLLVGLVHFRHGVQVVLEDYAHGTPRRAMVIAAICVTYAILATGVFAVARIAL